MFANKFKVFDVEMSITSEMGFEWLGGQNSCKKRSEINQQLMRKLYQLQDRFSDRFLVDFGANFGSIFGPKTYEIGVDFSGPRTLENSSRRREGSPKVRTPPPPPPGTKKTGTDLV